ncbi:MAG: hypothetical protein ACLGSH_18410 [Acidobacteriota bacterium]
MGVPPGDNGAWASPSFDDSAWPRLETGRDSESQGFRNLTGIAWYRRQIVVKTAEDANWQLGLVSPAVEDAAEIYWNGRLMGSYGKLPPDPVWHDHSGSGITRLSPHFPAFVPLGPEKSGVLVLRVWKAPYIYYSFANVGGLVAAPNHHGTDGLLGAIAGRIQARAVGKSEHGIPFAPRLVGQTLIGRGAIVAMQSAVQTRFQPAASHR